MTNINLNIKKRGFPAKITSHSYKLLAFWFFLIFTAVYLLKCPSIGAQSVREAVKICAFKVIPGIFPFAVLVNMTSRSGLPHFLGKIFGKLFRAAFGINEGAAYAFILGLLGGFPIGAVCVKNLYNDGVIGKKEAERLTAAVNLASPAFCIGSVGSLLSDAGLGVKLYICQLAASLTVLVLTRTYDEKPVTPQKKNRPPLMNIITDSISEGGLAMIKICSFVIFFAVIGDGICSVTERFFGSTAAAAAASFFEITLAVRKASVLPYFPSMLISAFALGYSGTSVHMQTAAVLEGCPISQKGYRRRRFIQGAISAAYMLIWVLAEGFSSGVHL